MKTDNLKLIPSILLSPFTSLTKVKTNTILEDRELLMKAYNEGLYHITLEENVDSIIETKLMKASNSFTSYGNKKCFFFAGIPSFDMAAINIKPDIKLTALKLNLTYEQLSHFKYRKENDKSIVYDGNLDLENLKMEKVRLGLSTKDNNFIYKKIEEEDYPNYTPNLNNEQLNLVNNNLKFKLTNYMIGLNKDLDLLKKQVAEFIKDERTTSSLINQTNEIIENNFEEFVAKTR